MHEGGWADLGQGCVVSSENVLSLLSGGGPLLPSGCVCAKLTQPNPAPSVMGQEKAWEEGGWEVGVPKMGSGSSYKRPPRACS